MLPYLVIGGDECIFWTLTPKTIQLYFEVHKKKLELEEQKMWLMGEYIRIAIASTQGFVVSVPLLDEKSARGVKMQDYPQCPHLSETHKTVLNEKNIEVEERKFMAWISSIKPLD